MNQSQEGLCLSAGFLLEPACPGPTLLAPGASWKPPSSPEGWFFGECVTGQSQTRAATDRAPGTLRGLLSRSHLGERHAGFARYGG